MIKIKNTSEENVKIHSVFPGKGKHKHGGFYYADESGQPLGRVGTGFTDETRAELPKYIGRTARVKYQEKFKSGKLRAPSLIAIEENK
jgi:ATP-dependent DNA ligase